MRTLIILGRYGTAGMTSIHFAEQAIAFAAQRGRDRMLVMLDLFTGHVMLTDPDAHIPPGTFVRGVAFDSDPDILADDLREEAHAAALIEARQNGSRRKAPRKRA